MAKKNSLKKALIASALSLTLSCSMLVGTTYAWFTDSVTSGSNIIQAGTLKVDLVDKDGNSMKEKVIKFVANRDQDAILWEPGCTYETEPVYVKNKGNLALTYKISIKGIDGNAKLLEAIEWTATVDGATTALADLNGYLAPDTQTGAIVLRGHMKEEAGNEYQNLKAEGISISVLAIQYNSEEDSFGPDYDKDLDPEASYVATPADLQEAVKKSGKIVLMDDISLDSDAEFMATNGDGSLLDLKNVNVTLDLNGHNIVAEADALMEGKTSATALFLVHRSTLNIIGDGEIITKNQSIPVYGWLESEINIYGGTFKGNAYERNESDVYVNNDTVTINVYGGDFTECPYAFNAHDNCGTTPVIILHEGVIYKDFLKNGTTNVIANDVNNGRIQYAEGCSPVDVEINGETWHQVVKGSGVSVSSASDLITALDTEGAYIVLQNDVDLDQSVTVNKSVTLNLNNKTLKTMGLEFKADATIENGTIASGGNTDLVPHLKASAGTLTMNNVTVDVKHHLNANKYWSEATGMEVQDATAILNNCNIKINNATKAQWVYSYGISINNAEVTVNGGSITAECVAGTAANGPTNPNAISAMGECTVTLNNVNVTATYYVTTVDGHATVNTTDKNITNDNIVDNRGGGHTLNYID